jgi:hypothetical protein
MALSLSMMFIEDTKSTLLLICCISFFVRVKNKLLRRKCSTAGFKDWNGGLASGGKVTE